MNTKDVREHFQLHSIRFGVGAALLLSTLGSGVAHAATCGSDIGVLGTTPFSCDVTGIGAGVFLGTINFSVADPNTLVTITSVVNNISFFSLPIFENGSDSQYVADNDGQHIDVDLSAFTYLADPDYHVHPQGFIASGSGSYTLTFSSAAPVPEAETYGMMLAGLGLVGFAVRRRR